MPNPSPALRHETSYPAAPTSSSGNLLDSDSDTSHWAHVVVPLLLKQYETNMYPTREETKAIAERLRVSQLSIDDWFRNRRWRLRKTSQPSTVQSPVVESNPPSGSNRIGAKEKQRLEEEFLKDSEMWQDRRVRLARELGLDEKTITSWFYMKRKLNPPSSKPGI
ncbi:hypothetical protein C8Q80DRAFT_1186074 [Daedaleopsis nitida]|nr:hypothetical protein C8Q80DRAFT_1186074 [Daedaleopsis nitida]